MRCPKCGYNSFDYLDNCKKCGKDLVEFRQRHGLKSILFPSALAVVEARTEEFSDADAAELAGAVTAGIAAGGATAAAVQEPDEETTDAADFGFDFMTDSSQDDDLSFDELFEETPDDEDVEEALEAPRSTATQADEVVASEESSFELPDADDDQDDELENDFGFDPSTFELDDDGELDEKDSTTGIKEDPRNPFDLPESSQYVGAPDTQSWSTETNDDSPQGKLLPDGVVAAGVMVPAQTGRDHGSDDLDVTETAGFSERDETEELSAEESRSVSLQQRFAAFVYDAVVLMVVGICFVVAGEMVLTDGAGPLPTRQTLINFSIPYFFILFFLTFGYFTLFHYLTGQTPGKMLTGVRVETLDGEPLPLTHAFLRSVGGLLLLLPLGLGYLLLLVRPDQPGWNDRFAGTRVVSANGRD